MTNHNLNNNYQEDEIDLREIFILLFNSRYLIISITVIFILIASTYSFLKKPTYISTAVMEISSYNNLYYINDFKNIIDFNSNTKSQNPQDIKDEIAFYFENIGFKINGKKFFTLNLTSPSIESNLNDLKLAIDYLDKSSKKFINRLVMLENYDFEKKLNFITTSIKMLEDELANLTNQKDLLRDDSMNVHISKLRLEINRLKIDELTLSNDNADNFRYISLHNEIITQQVASKKSFIILLGFILGFAFSIFIVFIRQFFLQEKR